MRLKVEPSTAYSFVLRIVTQYEQVPVAILAGADAGGGLGAIRLLGVGGVTIVSSTVRSWILMKKFKRG